MIRGALWWKPLLSAKGFTRDQRGWATVFVLFVIPFLVMGWLMVTGVTQAVTNADYDLKDSLEAAVKAANYQVAPSSQAAGDARVHADNAHAAFRRVLADTLRLDHNTLTPGENSPLEGRPQYTLVVYNGDNAYASSGAPGSRVYRFDGETLQQYGMMNLGFPCTFSIRICGDIDQGKSGSAVARVTLKGPGCVAWVRADLKKLVGSGNMQAARWMASEIVYR
jgi:hypothetical protein